MALCDPKKHHKSSTTIFDFQQSYPFQLGGRAFETLLGLLHSALHEIESSQRFRSKLAREFSGLT
jgi:hypothetical protein